MDDLEGKLRSNLIGVRLVKEEVAVSARRIAHSCRRPNRSHEAISIYKPEGEALYYIPRTTL